MKKIFILGFGGSLRKGSFSKAILMEALNHVPEGASLEIFEIGGIPEFNQDMEKDPPKVIRDFKAKIRAADAILISTPEYNYSVPGFLKNAIDWASRPYGDNAFQGKPVGIMSSSIAGAGGSRAQYHLRQIFVFLDMHPLNKPEVIVPEVHQKVDNEGNVTDQHTKEKIGELVQALVKWAGKLQG